MFDIKYDKDGMPIKFTTTPIPQEDLPQEEPENSPIEQEAQVAEPVESIQEESASVAETPKENNLERNARALRELKEKAEKDRIRAEKERDEALRRAQYLEEKYSRSNPNHSQKHESQEEDFNIGEDDLVEGKHVKKIQQYVKRLENKLNQYEQKSHQNTLQDRIRYDFPDFNRVVTPENIELLRHLKPRQAQLLDSSTDLYATAASAYDMIKEYGIYQEPSVIRDKESVQRNIAKPRPTNSISPQRSNSPLTQANDFANGWTGQDSPEAKATYKQMLEAMRGR